MNDTLLETATPTTRSWWSFRYTGFLMVVIASTLWGLSGTAAQKLFQGYGITPGWLVAARMSVSGLLLLLAVMARNGGRNTFAIWRHPSQWMQLLVFAILGLIGVQYTYFAAIHLGNAATATFLQYLGPAVIMVYIAVRHRRRPTRRETLALALALAGTFLLVTNGSTEAVVVPMGAVIWGLLSAVTLAFYTLYPGSLLKRWGSATVVGWAMFLGGIICVVADRPWQVPSVHWDVQSSLLVGFVILFGTLLAFYLYLASTKYISPAETSLIASCEPLSAAVASVVWLHTQLGAATVAGGVCILVMVVLLTRQSTNPS